MRGPIARLPSFSTGNANGFGTFCPKLQRANPQEMSFSFRYLLGRAAVNTRNACRRYPTVKPSNYDDPESGDNTWRAIALGFFAGLIWLLWQAMRLPALALLLILEPIVSLLLTAAALFGTFTAFFWTLASNHPAFPFFGLLALSLGCFLLLILYRAAIQLLSGANRL